MKRIRETFRCLLVAWLVATAASSAFAQGSNRIWDVTDPPVFSISASTYDIASGVVTRDTGTFVFPTWAAGARVQISGTLYSVATRDSDTQITLDNLTVNATDQTISMGPDASYPNDAVDDTTNLQAFFDSMVGSTWGGSVILMPGVDPRNDLDDVAANEWGYLLSDTLTIKLLQGQLIQGGGLLRQVAVPPTTHAGGSPTKSGRFTWANGAGAVGPMVLIEDCSGLVLDGVNFIGNDGTDAVTPLVRFDNTAEGSNDIASVNRLSNCSFHQYQIGCQLSSTTGSNSAEFMWDNCFFDGNQSANNFEAITASPVTQAAVWITSDQQLNFTFTHCEIIDSAIAIYFKRGGSFRWYGGSSSLCGDFLRHDDGSQNNSQFSIRDLYIDASGNMRQVLLRHGEPNGAGGGDTWGNVIFENFRHSADYPTHADDWVVVSTWPDGDNTITFSEPISLAPGDVISFQDATNSLTTRGPILDTTTVTVRTSTTQYEVSDIPDGLGLSALVAAGDLRANENNSTGRTCIASFTGNTVVFVDDISIRAGDTIAFVDSSDVFTRLATTKITTKNSDQSYTVEDTAAELGVDDDFSDGTLRAYDGTPLFYCTGGERLVVRDAYFLNSAVQAGRLARITEGTFGGGRNTYARFENCSLVADKPVDLPGTYLLRRSSDLGQLAVGSTITAPAGSSFYRFVDCSFYAGVDAIPMGLTNIPPFARVASANPTPADNVAAGYPIGARWQNDLTGKVFIHAADGRWIEITHRAPAPF